MHSHCYIALLHHPVLNKKGDIVTTAVTNMDIHDISRASRTYGLAGFYIVTPVRQQYDFVDRILNHWQKGFGLTYNPSRKKAFDIVSVKETLADTVDDITRQSGRPVRTIVTSAMARERTLSCNDMKELIAADDDAWLLIFGTGWGCTDEVIENADYILEPVKGPADYNHLSVRSAVSIVLDRLWGVR